MVDLLGVRGLSCSSCCHGLGLAVNGEDRDKVADLLTGYAIPFEKSVLLSSSDIE